MAHPARGRAIPRGVERLREGERHHDPRVAGRGLDRGGGLARADERLRDAALVEVDGREPAAGADLPNCAANPPWVTS